MAVRCLGESRLLEQVGEKQDFECVLTAQGFCHENFALRTRRVVRRNPGPDWACDYSVTVIRADFGIRHVYAGGPSYRWVDRFAADLAGGAYSAGSAAAQGRHRRNGGVAQVSSRCRARP